MAHQADAQRARIADEARAEAEKILGQGRDASQAHRESIWRTVKSEESHKDRMSRQFAQVDADKTRLAARNWAVGEVMQVVHQEIDRIVASPSFAGILERLLVEALEASSGPVIVEAPDSHVEAVRSLLKARGAQVVVVVASRTIRDGVAVWNPERTMRISNTLTARLAIVEDAARKHIVQQLFRNAG